ncbi:MAG TPA: response regulator, partial [Bacteroidota bacterium]|nr:response regulator [Bacteroidota bacterium]
GDGLEGIRLLELYRDEIDLVVSDVGMPGASGEEVFSAVKLLKPQTRMILASGFLEPDAKSELMKSGVYDFIQKPYLPEILLKKIRNAIDSRDTDQSRSSAPNTLALKNRHPSWNN